MVINCAFIGFGKSTTRYHLPYVLNRKDSWHVAHIFRRHAKPEEQEMCIRDSYRTGSGFVCRAVGGVDVPRHRADGGAVPLC